MKTNILYLGVRSGGVQTELYLGVRSGGVQTELYLGVRSGGVQTETQGNQFCLYSSHSSLFCPSFTISEGPLNVERIIMEFKIYYYFQ